MRKIKISIIIKFLIYEFHLITIFFPFPYLLAKLCVLILEKTPLSPLNSEQLKLFKNDNICSNNHKKLNDLEIYPQDIREIIKKIIKKNI